MTPTRATTPYLIAGDSPAMIITAGVAGGPVVLPAALLTNPLAVPIEVNEFSFLVKATTPSVVVGGVFLTTLDINLRVGRHDLTNGFAPLCPVGPNYDAATDSTVRIAGPGSITFYTVRWVLPRPMVLLPATALSGLVRLSPVFAADYATGNLTTSVVMTTVIRGRLYPAGAQLARSLPFPFVSGAYYSNAAVGAPDADDLTHMNTLKAPLNVTSINAVGAGVNILPATARGNATITGPGGALGTPRRIVASGDTDGIFAQRNSIEVSHVLQPRESYRVVWDSAPTTLGGAAVNISGYREEAP